MSVYVNGVEEAGGLAYTDYEYEADLGAGVTYTPPASTLWAGFGEFFNSTNINIEWYDDVNSSWTAAIVLATSMYRLYQEATQRWRVINDSGSAKAIGFYGVTWS